MNEPLPFLQCSPDIAAWLGARQVHIAADDLEYLDVSAVLRFSTCDAIAAKGREIPILSRGGPVYAWPVQPGARDSGAGR